MDLNKCVSFKNCFHPLHTIRYKLPSLAGTGLGFSDPLTHPVSDEKFISLSC
jgi:hypothetical protein